MKDEKLCVACSVRTSMALGMILAVMRFSIETISVQGILSVVSQPGGGKRRQVKSVAPLLPATQATSEHRTHLGWTRGKTGNAR